jgi:hypothetical protein
MRSTNATRLAPRARPAPADACACCNATGQAVQLAHDGTGARLTVCPRCLRSSMRMQADLSEARNLSLMQDYALEYGYHVWNSNDVVYLLPPERPFAPALQPRRRE